MLMDGVELAAGSEIKNMSTQKVTAFPELPSNGKIVYLTEVSGEYSPGTYIYEEGAWIDLTTKPAAEFKTATFSVPGPVTAPLETDAVWYPKDSAAVHRVEYWVSSPSAEADLSMELHVNGVAVQSFVLTAAAKKGFVDNVNAPITAADEVTVKLLSAPVTATLKNLVVRIYYK